MKYDIIRKWKVNTGLYKYILRKRFIIWYKIAETYNTNMVARWCRHYSLKEPW